VKTLIVLWVVMTTFSFAQILGLSNSEITRDENSNLEKVSHSGYSAEIIHTELSDNDNNNALVFMSYAIWGGNNFDIIIRNKNDHIIKKWSFKKDQKTGVISFPAKNGENILFFEVRIKGKFPFVYSEPFLINIKKEINEIPNLLEMKIKEI